MAFITESMLSRFAHDTSMLEKARIYVKSTILTAKKAIFLSHSHKDGLFVKGFINYLGTLGFDIYVDWQDSDMPRTTNRGTAEKIKKQIANNEFFLVLATTNALNSRWVPWEIGVADQIKTNHGKMAIIPIVDEFGEFKGNEYLQLYKRITLDEVFQNRLKLYEASSSQGQSISDWLSL